MGETSVFHRHASFLQAQGIGVEILKERIKKVGVLLDALSPSNQSWAFNYWYTVYWKLIDKEYRKGKTNGLPKN
jgi:hypothetical protein